MHGCPTASAALAGKLLSPPPGLRLAGLRGILEVLSYPGQVGYSAYVNAGASLEYSVMDYRSSTLAFQSYGAQQPILVRLVGQAARGHGGCEWKLSQRAKVGYCPCCTTLTHIGAPPS